MENEKRTETTRYSIMSDAKGGTTRNSREEKSALEAEPGPGAGVTFLPGVVAGPYRSDTFEKGPSVSDPALDSGNQTDTSASPYLDDDEEEYPEGGKRAWLVVLGSWFALFAALGLMNILATFQTYVSTHQLAEYDASTIGWILSLYSFTCFFLGIYIGPVFDKYGPRWLVAAGTVGLVASLMFLSVCTGNGLSTQTLSLPSYPLLTSLRILPIPPRLRSALGRLVLALIHPLHRRHRPLLQSPTRPGHRCSLHCRLPWRCDLPAHAGVALRQGRLGLGHPHPRLHLSRPHASSQLPHPLPSAACPEGLCASGF